MGEAVVEIPPFYFLLRLGEVMVEAVEIREGIQQKRLEREEAIKAIWEDVAKKRKEIKEYKKRFFKK